MNVQEVILRAMAKKITWWQAAEIIGMSDRQMRRLHWRYRSMGMTDCWTAGGPAQSQARAAGGGRAGARAVPGEVFQDLMLLHAALVKMLTFMIEILLLVQPEHLLDHRQRHALGTGWPTRRSNNPSYPCSR